MSIVQITKDMIAPMQTTSFRVVLDRVHSLRENQSLGSYGKNSVDWSAVVSHPLYVKTQEENENYIRFVLQAFKHAQYILDHAEKFLVLFTDTTDLVTIKHAGIATNWKRNQLHWLSFKPEAVDALLAGKFTRLPRERNLEYGAHDEKNIWVSDTDRLGQAYIGNPSTPLLLRTVWLGRRNSLAAVCRYTDVSLIQDPSNGLRPAVYTRRREISAEELITFQEIAKLLVSQSKIDRASFISLRRDVLALQARETEREDERRREMSSENFQKFWANIKDSKRAVQPSLSSAVSDWNTIPLLEPNTTSSRTWGIEVETVRAQDTSLPRGWKSVYDGSLPNCDGCNCDCEYCYDGDCCGDESCNTGESTEFVSPVLKHFNSAGLRSICEDLGPYESSTAPGIHVHVGSDNLSVSDISRLLFAYGVTSPLFEGLYYRKERGYCKDTASQRVTYWLNAARKIAKGGLGLESISDVAYNQPGDRYYDVNLESINKHGTIEFRAMGPRYDYNHLVRWAWFCREMLNVSKLGLPQDVWTSCGSVADVIKVLRTYGSEASYPDKTDYKEVPTSQLVLTEQ